jgi:hypothetical protein
MLCSALQALSPLLALNAGGSSRYGAFELAILRQERLRLFRCATLGYSFGTWPLQNLPGVSSMHRIPEQERCFK